MRARGWAAVVGVVLLLVLAGPGAGARLADPATPPLTGAQLLELHAVTAWDLDYSETVNSHGAETIDGTVPSPFTSTFTTTASRSVNAHLTVDGKLAPTDCALAPGIPVNPCVPD